MTHLPHNTLTVKKLKEKLARLPDTTPVMVSGPDGLTFAKIHCTGEEMITFEKDERLNILIIGGSND